MKEIDASLPSSEFVDETPREEKKNPSLRPIAGTSKTLETFHESESD